MAKAERFLGDAEEAFRAEMWETCVARCYYAAYHLVAALLESRGGLGEQEWRHEQLRDQFHRRFGARGFLFARGDTETLAQLYRERVEADYREVRFTGRRARTVLATTRGLCYRLLEQVRDV